jgi:hypothetical protein
MEHGLMAGWPGYPASLPDAPDKKHTILVMTACLRGFSDSVTDAFHLAATIYDQYDELIQGHVASNQK